MENENIITQLSIFVNNEPGRLAAVAGILKECKVNMKVCNLAESTEFGILRAVVDDPEQAYKCMVSKGLIVKKTEMVGVKVSDSPGSIFDSAHVLGDAGINIEYGYAYSGSGNNILFVRVDDPLKAVSALNKAGVSLVKNSEI